MFEKSLYGTQKEIQAKTGINLLRNPFFVADSTSLTQKPAGWTLTPSTGFSVVATDGGSQVLTLNTGTVLLTTDLQLLNSGNDSITLPLEFTLSVYYKPDTPSSSDVLVLEFLNSSNVVVDSTTCPLANVDWALVHSQIQLAVHSFRLRITAPRNVAIKLVSLVPGTLEPEFFVPFAMTEQNYQQITGISGNLAAEIQARIDGDAALQAQIDDCVLTTNTTQTVQGIKTFDHLKSSFAPAATGDVLRFEDKASIISNAVLTTDVDQSVQGTKTFDRLQSNFTPTGDTDVLRKIDQLFIDGVHIYSLTIVSGVLTQTMVS